MNYFLDSQNYLKTLKNQGCVNFECWKSGLVLSPNSSPFAQLQAVSLSIVKPSKILMLL
jgi:hypothetical protein